MKKNILQKLGAATILSIVILLCFSWFVPAQVTQIGGLAVAQSGTQWNRLKDASQGDSLTNGIGVFSPYLFNGTTFDRQRGSAAGGAEVNLKSFSGGITPNDAFANPTDALKTFGLGAVFNGTTWDRTREATADAAANTGMQGTVPMLFRESDNTLVRSRGQTAPVQMPNNENQLQTSAANTAVSKTITPVGGQRAHLYKVTARCSAGTSNLSITDGGTTVWNTAAAEVGVVNFEVRWNPGLTSTSANNVMVITLATCGVANTGTLITQADRFIQ